MWAFWNREERASERIMALRTDAASAAHMPQKLYVLGHPVGHSKSPVMYEAAYGALGLPWDYGLMDCPDDECARAFLDERDFLSINITTPFKPLALAVATVQSPSARLAEGANVLINGARVGASEGLTAFNTDGVGCVGYLRRCGVDFSRASVVVCGTGPTSRAILHAVINAGAAKTTLLGRDLLRTRATVEAYVNKLIGIARSPLDAESLEAQKTLDLLASHVVQAGSYQTADGVIASATVIIDATSLGMLEGDPAPFDTALLRQNQVVFDTVYGHGETALLKAARKTGCRAFDGAGMLVGQAVATVELVCTSAGVELTVDPGALFDLMAQAAFPDSDLTVPAQAAPSREHPELE